MDFLDDDERLLRIVGRMPLASAGDLVPVVGADESDLRERMQGLRSAGWLASVRRGMLRRSQDRWFLTLRSVETLYACDHAHPNLREIARAGGLQGLLAGERPPQGWNEFLALDHEHLAHLEDARFSPFSPFKELRTGGAVRSAVSAGAHEHPPWTATSRGVRACLRRLAALELIYERAPLLLQSGMVIRPAGPSGVGGGGSSGGSCVDVGSGGSGGGLSMTDFRLLRHGGYFHAVARYGEAMWTTFTYVGKHVTERAMRRKYAHRFWGLDCYLAAADRYFRISNRVFYEDPDQTVAPSAQIIVAADAWAAELALRTCDRDVPTLICTPDGSHTGPVVARWSRDCVSDPAEHPSIGRPETIDRWWTANPDLEAIGGSAEFRLFMTIAEFPAMRVSWLREIAGISWRTARRGLERFVETELIAVFDGRYYLAERGMRRAANLSRVLPGVVSRRHIAYLVPEFREHELRHNEGVNRLALRFAREGVTAIGGWRGEINLPDITQVKPDLVVLVTEGPFGPGRHCVEYERSAVAPNEAYRKLGTYRKCAAAGRTVPVLVVTDTARAAFNFAEIGSDLPLLATSLETALAGPLTGDVNVWRLDGDPVTLRCG